MHPSLVIHNGNIVTNALTGAHAQALAVRGDRVAGAGSNAEVLATAGSGTRLVDLRGRFVCPGFIDAHVHIAWLGMVLGGRTVECEGARSLAEALERVREGLGRAVGGGWLQGRGWDKNQWPEDRFPTAADLDPVTGELPTVLASHDGHSLWANSAALRAAGVTAQTPDPADGRILRDEAGRPTGVLQEGACQLLRSQMPAPSAEEMTEALRASLPRISALGLTGVHNCGLGDCPSILEGLRDTGELSLRVTNFLLLGSQDPVAGMAECGSADDEWVRLGGVKVFVDGSLGGQTAAMLEPYADSDNTGVLTMEPEAFADLAGRATAGGVAMAVHAIGDRAVRMVLDGFQQVRERWSGPWPRHRIEHAQHVQPADQARFGSLDVIASMQPVHLLADIGTCDRYLGERGRWAFPLRSLLQGGARLALGSDAPVEIVDPLVGFRAALQRRRRDGTPAAGWYPEQKLTAAEALAGYTLGAAYASGEEDLKGSLAPGKLADFVVLSHDLLTTPADALDEARVLATVVGGEVRHDPEGMLEGRRA
jgi:predicted amidohydrolase YtcJ